MDSEKNGRLSYLQSRNGGREVNNKYVDTKVEEGDGIIWEIGIDIYTSLSICKIAKY